MKTRRRLYVPDIQFRAGQTITLPPAQSHYLITVLRLAADDAVHVFNPISREWAAEILTTKKSGVQLKLLAPTRAPQPEIKLSITLAFAPLKKDRTDFLVEKASELGVHVLQPVFTDHTQSGRVNIERLQATAIEAAEQCDRLDAPQILAPVKLQDYLASLRPSALLFLAAESGTAEPIATVFMAAKSDIQTAHNIHFLIGPEGGFSAAEFETFDRRPNIYRLRLGPRLLRAETAALAVLANFQALLGDWL